ncbi:MAG: NAD-dependent epimerase/dehydratase family protein [Actinoallomurus sp.]
MRPSASGPRTSGTARVVLVTGVSRFLGARVADTLQADPSIERVIGVDTVAPTMPLGRTEFVRVDIRTPSIAKIINAAEVDTVVHLNLVTMTSAARMKAKELNVIGTMQLLAACQRSAAMRKVVVRSSAAVYGSSGHDPAVFTETDEPVLPPASGYAKDAVEVEGYVRGLARRRSDLTVSVLRFANFLGPHVDSPLSRYFHMPVVATVLGFDPRLQFIHEDDGVEVLRRMAVDDHPGTFNVAGDGVVLLSQALRRGGRPILRLPAPALQTLGDVGRRFGGLKGFSPELLRWLTYGRVLDTDLLAKELAWRPKYSSEEAFTDFADSQGLGQSLPLGLLDRLTSAVGGRR